MKICSALFLDLKNVACTLRIPIIGKTKLLAVKVMVRTNTYRALPVLHLETTEWTKLGDPVITNSSMLKCVLYRVIFSNVIQNMNMVSSEKKKDAMKLIKYYEMPGEANEFYEDVCRMITANISKQVLLSEKKKQI